MLSLGILANDDCQAPCLSEDKQLELASFLIQYLGFLIHTHRMIMAWSVDKCQQLADLLDGILSIASRKITPKQSSSLLGLVHNGAVVAHLAMYLSLHLQHQLNDAMHNAWDPCLTVLNGYGTSLIATGFNVGIGNIASNWTLQPYVIFVYFGLNSPLLLSILFGVG
jgi:hypothetical protein